MLPLIYRNLKNVEKGVGELLRYQLPPIIPELTSWEQVQHIVRAGIAPIAFPIGTQFVAEYDEEPAIFDVIGHNHDIPVDDKYQHTMTLQAHDGLESGYGFAFSTLYYAKSELPAGVQYFTMDGVQYTFTTTKNVPAGGVVKPSWDGDKISKVYTIEANRLTTIESILPVSEGQGVDTLTPINPALPDIKTNSKYLDNQIHHWLNSDEEEYTMFFYDDYICNPVANYLLGPGFLYKLDPELMAVLGEVKKQVAIARVYGGGQAAFNAKVFLLSQVEVAGTTTSAGTTTGEKPYAYYAKMPGAPTTGEITGRIKVKYNTEGLAAFTWLRGPFDNSSTSIRQSMIDTDGSISWANESYGCLVAPAIVIY